MATPEILDSKTDQLESLNADSLYRETYDTLGLTKPITKLQGGTQMVALGEGVELLNTEKTRSSARIQADAKSLELSFGGASYDSLEAIFKPYHPSNSGWLGHLWLKKDTGNGRVGRGEVRFDFYPEKIEFITKHYDSGWTKLAKLPLERFTEFAILMEKLEEQLVAKRLGRTVVQAT